MADQIISSDFAADWSIIDRVLNPGGHLFADALAENDPARGGSPTTRDDGTGEETPPACRNEGPFGICLDGLYDAVGRPVGRALAAVIVLAGLVVIGLILYLVWVYAFPAVAAVAGGG